jgi:hypothetical protein
VVLVAAEGLTIPERATAAVMVTAAVTEKDTVLRKSTLTANELA